MKPNRDKLISENSKIQDFHKIQSEFEIKSVQELNKLLADAVQLGNVELVKELLKNRPGINNTSGDGYGNTPLAIACQNGHNKLVELLIELGADANQSFRDGDTALLKACNGYKPEFVTEIVEVLLKHGANPNLFTAGNDGPLHYAAMFGHFGAVKLLVQYGAKINFKGSYKRTPLIYAAADAAMPEMVKFLIESGADLNAKNESGENALFELITRDNPNTEVAEILIDSGLSIKIKSKLYGTPLHWAAFCGRTNIVELLLKKAAKVNEKDKNGETAIIKAMSQNHMAIVKLLFENGADINSKSQFGWSLMEFVTESGDKEFLQKIIDKSAKGKIKANAALCEAAKKGNLAMVKMLIEAGSGADDRDNWGSETPLMKASYYGKIEIVKFLLENNADIKATDYRGNTPLLHAAWSGHLDVVKELIANGADINEKNKLNWNALMQATVEGHFEVAKYLLELGSPTDEVDLEKGATALTIAKVSNHSKLVKLLESFGAKERSLNKRAKGEPWFSIFDCEICRYIPDKKDLGNTERMEEFDGLEDISSDYGHPDRYMDSTSIIKKCTNCGTYYLHEHSIDTEDAFVGGPRITHEIQRINLYRLKDALIYANKPEEIKEFELRYPAMIEDFLFYLHHKPESIIPNYSTYIIESITDYFVSKNDWEGLIKNLLRHPNPSIVLDTAHDLILMFGEMSRGGPYPPYTQYKTINKELQSVFKPMLAEHLDEFINIIEKFSLSEEPRIKAQYKSVKDSAKYYKLF